MDKNVMVVDDDQAVLNTVRRILEYAGFEVVTAESGERCLEILGQGFHGLILMDVVMPGLDGWDTIQAIVDQGFAKGNIICMLTAKEVPDPRMDTLKEYILDYITKPFAAQQLINVVTEYIDYLPDTP
ncbi:response regulator [bacterium]|nr:response regulator [bacterium]